VRQLGYQWAYIFTAIRPATGEDVTLVLPAVNGAAMQVDASGNPLALRASA
jgi:hypothetical protein